MHRFAFALSLILVSGPVQALQDIDGSFIALPTAHRGNVEYFVVDKLKDPGAAQLKGMRYFEGPKGTTVCGLLNAKNSYGGYIGFEPFAVVFHPNGKFSTYNPHAFTPETRPSLRDAVQRQGC